MARQLSEELNSVLKQTSRAFYLSLVLLPKASRFPLSLAYLLARAADTVADSEAKSNADRKQTLLDFTRAIQTPDNPGPLSLNNYHPDHEGEQRLLDSVDLLISILADVPEKTKEAVSNVVESLITGMLKDIEWFGSGSVPQGLDDEQLEFYTYSVAGCVGPFWTEICAGNDVRSQHMLTSQNLFTALEFGKALQFVNILRDIPKDRLTHRYYLPPQGDPRFEQRFVQVARRALGAFQEACSYPSLFPTSFIRNRWAVLLPLVLGLRTLEKLFLAGGPRQDERIKVSRTEVVLWLSLGPILVSHDLLLNKILNRLLMRAKDALDDLEYKKL